MPRPARARRSRRLRATLLAHAIWINIPYWRYRDVYYTLTKNDSQALLVVVLAVNQALSKPSAWLAVIVMGVLVAQIPGQMGILNGLLARMIPPATSSVLLSFLLAAGTAARILGPLLGGNFAYSVVWWGLFGVTTLGMLLHCFEYSKIGGLISFDAPVPSQAAVPLLSSDANDEPHDT